MDNLPEISLIGAIKMRATVGADEMARMDLDHLVTAPWTFDLFLLQLNQLLLQETILKVLVGNIN